ncbi:hypothetical protein [Liquorilactobacillus nagelii]|nr:hypothetical protein [Liquorilactobacillus nagelii]
MTKFRCGRSVSTSQLGLRYYIKNNIAGSRVLKFITIALKLTLNQKTQILIHYF